MTEYRQYQERRRLRLRPDRKARPIGMQTLALVNGVQALAKLRARIDELRDREEEGTCQQTEE